MSLWMLLATLLTLDPAAAPRLPAGKTATAPVLDGRLDEEVWRAAPASRAFTQRFPEEGRAPSEATSVRVLYDQSALYVGIDCEQQGTPLLPRLARRDREAARDDKLERREGALDSDQVAVSISSRGDRSSAFHFVVNAPI